jgi:glutamyl-tRNA synthetase
MTVITRFAPSPTGYLHIGGARTALFNYLFAKAMGGKMLLRIEDTDRARSTEGAITAIIDGLEWMGLHHDGEVIFQFARSPRHAEVALEMLKNGKAYYCYCSQDELTEMRETAQKEGRPPRYDGRWRDRTDVPEGIKPVIRLKSPNIGKTIVDDKVQGRVEFDNKELDDLILLRSDGTPTYMLAVVVDDHDMGVTHIIRGNDHFTNAARQIQIYEAMGWNVPIMAHIPLIHGADGAKLSKRHGALGIEAYRDMGYLPAALRNYLVRLGWSHGDQEIFTQAELETLFNLESVGSSPSRLDFAKLENTNGHYIKAADDAELTALVTPFLPAGTDLDLIRRGMKGLKERAKTLVELAAEAAFLTAPRPLILDEKAKLAMTDEAKILLKELTARFETVQDWTAANTDAVARALIAEKGVKLGAIAQPLRCALTGKTTSSGIFDVVEVLGKAEVLGRLNDVI